MNTYRRNEAWRKRSEANDMANQRPHPRHLSNGDEQKFRHKEDSEISKKHKKHHIDCKKHLEKKGVTNSAFTHQEKIALKNKPSYLMSFTNGMPHNYDTGLLNDPIHYQYFVRAIDSGSPRDFRDTPLGPDAAIGNTHYTDKPQSGWYSDKAKKGDCGKPVGLRAWESQSAGLSFELEGPDAQAVTMPPAPRLGSHELTAEIAEVYVQALLRDIPFSNFSAGIVNTGYLNCKNPTYNYDQIVNDKRGKLLCINEDQLSHVVDKTKKLRKLKWFSEAEWKLNPQETARRCNR